MNDPLVTVIMPCYNAEKYVESSVRSIMSQTYKNIEILVADDFSTDTTFEILQKAAKGDPRIIVLKNECNLKIVKTLNKMVKLASGKYIARMDADDIALPTRIEKQVAFLESNPNYAMCGTNAWLINKWGEKIGESCLPIRFEDNKFFLTFYSTFYHPTVMFRAHILKENQYSEKFPYAEDYELWCRLVFEKELKITNIKEKLLEYRIFKNQTSTVHFTEQNESCKRIVQKYRLISEKDLESHVGVFFENRQDQQKKQYKYLKELNKTLAKTEFEYAFPVYSRILFRLKNISPSKFLKMLFTFRYFYTFCRVLKRKTELSI